MGMARTVRALFGARFGAVARMDGPALAKVLSSGTERRRLHAAVLLAERPEPQALAALRERLDDPMPGVRRLAAGALGRRGDAGDDASLEVRLLTEPCTSVALALAAALATRGRPLGSLVEVLGRRASRPLMTARGERSPEEAAGFTSTRLAIDLLAAVAGGAELPQAGGWDDLPRPPREALRRELRARLEDDPASPSGRRAAEVLGALGHPDDLDVLLEARARGGRRTDHAVLEALGRLGHPGALPLLVGCLDELDVDPGRAFAHRRVAAVALGRVGCPDVAPDLVSAIDRERRVHEGTPGAGLGIQYPVRTVYLWALGELQAERAAPLLAGHLGSMTSALGGFHLPAMGALVKLGAAAIRPTLDVALGPDADAAANAVGVLEAMARRGELERVAAAGGAGARWAREALARGS